MAILTKESKYLYRIQPSFCPDESGSGAKHSNLADASTEDPVPGTALPLTSFYVLGLPLIPVPHGLSLPTPNATKFKKKGLCSY